MGCAKSKLPCRDSTSGDEKLNEILTQKGLIYSPSSYANDHHQPYNYSNGYTYQNQQFYVPANDCANSLVPYEHYYVYRHPVESIDRSGGGGVPNQYDQLPYCQPQYCGGTTGGGGGGGGGQENVFTRLSGRIRRPKNGTRRRGDQFDQRVTEKYDVKALIGKGSFSRVVRVEHRMSRHHFAMKVMPAENGTGPFENELSILSRLSHVHVIRLVEVFRTDTRVYVVMELANGGELYDRIISKGRFSEYETALSLRMVLDGLSYLHRIGVSHRDLKPENILYYTPAGDSKLMITDFGLAHQNQCNDDAEAELMMDPCGTPEYIAPEILARIPYTNKVDLWAIGVITFILLSGSMPFDDENRTVLYRHILRCKYHFYPELWCDVSDEAKQFVGSLLCLDPVRRLSADQASQSQWITTVLNRDSEQSAGHRRTVHKSHSAQDDTGRHRSRSTRSIRSVARSDAGRRVNKAEVDRLHQDPEIRRILFEATRNQQLQPPSSTPHPINGVLITATAPANGRNGNAVSSTLITTTNYGVL